MSKLKVVIEYISGNADSKINNATLPGGNNTSTGDITNPVPNPKPFVFGASKVGEGQKFISRYNGFASRQVSDASGEFSPPIEIKIRGDNIETLRFKFSESLNQWATELEFNGVTYQNDGLVFTVAGLPLLTNQEYTLKVRKWSAPKFNCRIDNVSLDYVREYDERQIEDMDVGAENATGDGSLFYGLMGQSGDITIKDLMSGGEYEIKQLAGLGLLVPESPISLFMYEGKVVDMRSQNWQHSQARIVADLEDKMVDLQEDIMEDDKMFVDLNQSVYTLFNKLTSGRAVDIDAEAEYMLKNTTIPYLYLEEGDMWQGLQKISDACLLRMWEEKDALFVRSFR